jgi:glutathione S-transferase
MPVTARLPRKFYERFGDELTNELVEWFNLVDATYRSDLRELNELNFARFDAKLEQRIAELRADTHAALARLEAKLEQRIAELRADVKAELAALETRLTRRLLGFWIAQATTTAGLVFGVVTLLHL